MTIMDIIFMTMINIQNMTITTGKLILAHIRI